MTIDKKKLHWRVYTEGLLREMLENNHGMKVFEQPVKIFLNILGQVAARAIELDDVKLNKLMLRLSLFTAANPKSPDFDPVAVSKYLDMEEK